MSPLRKPRSAAPTLDMVREAERPDDRCRLTVRLKVITPIYGGGTRAGESDDDDPIRAATVRGHLRFWWRATRGAEFASDIGMLFQREQEIWGGTQWKERPDDSKTKSRPSAVQVSVRTTDRGSALAVPPMADPRGYALFAARQAQRSLKQGVSFGLHLAYRDEHEDDVLCALKAWCIFGGYGARTRRGVGSLSPDGTATIERAGAQDRVVSVVPAANGEGVTLQALTDFLGGAAVGGVGLARPPQFPLLRGCSLWLGTNELDADQAWRTALSWLIGFRQTAARPMGGRRPGRSEWPEPDKMRQVCRLPSGATRWEHAARNPPIGAEPAWPRAALGLPIVVKFQSEKTRDNRDYYDHPEPGFGPRDGQGRWRVNQLTLMWQPPGSKAIDRLASPLVVKPFPLGNGKFLPCALWLDRAYPSGRVGLRSGEFIGRGTEADFDVIQARGDGTPLFRPLADPAVSSAPIGKKVRTAFGVFLASDFRGSTRLVTP